MTRYELPLHGRGASDNPPNRFEKLSYDRLPEADDDGPAPATQFYKDSSRSIITFNDSPDIGFEASINPYRGCEHGCVYCYARPFHEYLGLSSGLDFETKIMVKEDAPELLRRELASPRWKPTMIAVGSATDVYQPAERHFRLTRRCLEVLRDFRNPCAVVTKNHLVTRDADLLSKMARHDAAAVFVSITTLDGDLARRMEPRATHPRGRLAAIRELAEAKVPVGVMVAPVIPGLNDHEIAAILDEAARVGASFAGCVPVRLPHELGPLFERWLEQHFPDRKEKVLGRIRSLRGGKLNDPRFGARMRGEGAIADMIGQVFSLACRKTGVREHGPRLSTTSFRRTGNERLLFEW